MDELEMKNIFYNMLYDLISKKRCDRHSFLSIDEYNNRIKQLKHSKFLLKTPGQIISKEDYQMVREYGIIKINNKERLIKPIKDKILYYVTIDELFDILHSTHTTMGHCRSPKMKSELKSKYCNITVETILLYLNLCTYCQEKSHISSTDLVSKPILHSAHINLIDMQSQEIYGLRFILKYQDYSTKFVSLKALTSKHAEEIVHNLLDIFTIFGVPAILHFENDQELINSIISELKCVRPAVNIVQSEKCIQSVSPDIEDMLTIWMAQNKCKNWPFGLKFVQFQKNCELHSGIGKSPFEAMFGYKARVGLKSINTPVNEICNLSSEEDIEEIMPHPENRGDYEIGRESLITAPEQNKKSIVNKFQGNITDGRNSIKCIQKQTKRMVTRSLKKNQELEVGTNVHVCIPNVDITRGSPSNLLAVITHIDNGFYELCTENGFLKNKFTRSQFVPCNEMLLDFRTLLKSFEEKDMTLQETAGCSSLMGTQGDHRCHCKMKYKSKTNYTFNNLSENKSIKINKNGPPTSNSNSTINSSNNSIASLLSITSNSLTANNSQTSFGQMPSKNVASNTPSIFLQPSVQQNKQRSIDGLNQNKKPPNEVSKSTYEINSEPFDDNNDNRSSIIIDHPNSVHGFDDYTNYNDVSPLIYKADSPISDHVFDDDDDNDDVRPSTPNNHLISFPDFHDDKGDDDDMSDDEND